MDTENKDKSKRPYRGERGGSSNNRAYGSRSPEGGDKPYYKRRAPEGEAEREGRPFRERKEGESAERKPYAGRSFEGKKPYGERRSESGDKPYYKRRAEGEAEKEGRPIRERKEGESAERKPYAGRSFEGKKPYDERRSEGGDKPFYKRRAPEGEAEKEGRPFRERKEGEGAERKPYAGRSFEGKKPYGDRRPESGDKPYYKRRAEGEAEKQGRPFRERKEGEGAERKPYAGRSYEGKKPYGDRLQRERAPYGGGQKREYAYTEDKNPQETERAPRERLPDIELVIDRPDDRFAGVAYIGADRYTVEGGLPKEKILARVKKTEFGVRYADIVSVLEPSPFRVEPSCPYDAHCGGCTLLHVQYEEELRQKTALVKKKLLPFEFYNVDDCVPSSADGFASRNKAHIAFEYRGKDLCVGFFDEATHHVVNVPVCAMHGDWYTRLVKILRDWVTRFDVQVYEPRTKKGHLRFAAARYLRGYLMLTIVTASPRIGSLQELYNMLRVSFPRLSFWKNLNTELTNEVMAGQMTHVAGDKQLVSEMMGLRYRLSPESFFQVNEKTAEAIYQKVFDILRESGIKNVVDLYSGIGITSALLAKAGFNVTSIEIEQDAVRDAKTLCEQNGITGVRHLCGDVKEMLPSIAKPDGALAFFVDPPRAGLGEEVCKTIAAFAPDILLYLSCNPSTLATDLETLLPAGYTIKSASPYDMFPHSRHVETVVRLTRQ